MCLARTPPCSDPSAASVPVALGVPLERPGELGNALAAPDGALDEIDTGRPRSESPAVRATA